MEVYSIEKADVAELSVEMMEETFLNMQKFKFEIVMKDKVIKLELNMFDKISRPAVIVLQAFPPRYTRVVV